MQFEFTYTPADERDVLFAEIPGKRTPPWILLIILVANCVVWIVSCIKSWRGDWENWAVVIASTLLVLFYFAFPRISAMCKRLVVSKPESKSLQKSRRVAILDDGIFVTDDSGQHRYFWSGFEGWTETGNHLILFLGSAARCGIPKRHVDPSDLDSLRSLLDAHMKPGFPVLPAK